MEETPQERFERMAKEAHESEDLVYHYLTVKHDMGFYLTPQDKQKKGIKKGWHVPDIQSHKRIQTTIEVKEDIRCGQSGNLAFESDCLERLKSWSIAHSKPNMFLAYINHKDFHVDFFQCGHDVDRLRKELEWLCVLRPDCKEVQGGDQGIKLWIIPLAVARSMICCVTPSIMSHSDNVGFSFIAKIKLQRK